MFALNTGVCTAYDYISLAYTPLLYGKIPYLHSAPRSAQIIMYIRIRVCTQLVNIRMVYVYAIWNENHMRMKV